MVCGNEIVENVEGSYLELNSNCWHNVYSAKDSRLQLAMAQIFYYFIIFKKKMKSERRRRRRRRVDVDTSGGEWIWVWLRKRSNKQRIHRNWKKKAMACNSFHLRITKNKCQFFSVTHRRVSINWSKGQKKVLKAKL